MRGPRSVRWMKKIIFHCSHKFQYQEYVDRQKEYFGREYRKMRFSSMNRNIFQLQNLRLERPIFVLLSPYGLVGW